METLRQPKKQPAKDSTKQLPKENVILFSEFDKEKVWSPHQLEVFAVSDAHDHLRLSSHAPSHM